ncbi:multiheme c-type cytochrome [Archaeoglobus veneficus]|uniref:Uncharacterized protein n=1 Tax=Archaeoglobus veneficus (strain DSM 11195 / SNP6) TaxID=693661 RepID=F2KPZ1_ARCVS|nr:multiheme c-type cytochrome [Archaeoglobus veneficus]AEA46498.1 hypothetical protein Arcve_0466 [Archaeoglobus veneficus SNP6]
MRLIPVLVLILALLMAACAEKPEPVGKAETVKPTVKPIERETLYEKAEERTLSTATTSLFAASGNCEFCHNGLVDRDGNDVSIVNDWSQTMMSNSARDALWQAKVSSEVSRNPHLREVIEEKCAACHMPMAKVQAKVDGKTIAVLDGFLKDGELHEIAMDGVSCTLCHQIQDVNFGKEESFSGGYVIDTETPKPDRTIFGPFKEPAMALMMKNHVGYTPEFGSHVEESELCAVCHTLYTPYLDSNGSVAGVFPEQTAYLELLHSSVNKSCQDCHMPKTDGVRISSRPMNPNMLPERSPFGKHHFAGGNVPMLQALGCYTGAERTMEQLRTAATLTIESAAKKGDEIEVIVKVENKAGHKFPTGFPSRRAWIHLKVVDKDGNVVFESGKPDSDGRISGCDSDEGKGYEQHYDVITRSDEVEVYESVMVDTEGQVTYTLLKGARYIKDNRLLPYGFDKTTASEDIAVHGKAAEDLNFVRGGDEVKYIVKTSGSGPYRVYAELLYQPASYPFIADLQKDDTEYVEKFLADFASVEKTIAVSSAEAVVE